MTNVKVKLIDGTHMTVHFEDEQDSILNDHPAYPKWVKGTYLGQLCRVRKSHILLVFEDD